MPEIVIRTSRCRFSPPSCRDTIARFRKADVIYVEDFYRIFGYRSADQANGGSLQGMLEAAGLIAKRTMPVH